jgi:hypothetical protein
LDATLKPEKTLVSSLNAQIKAVSIACTPRKEQENASMNDRRKYQQKSFIAGIARMDKT